MCTGVSNLVLLELQKSEAIFDYDLCLLTILGSYTVLYTAVDSVPCAAYNLLLTSTRILHSWLCVFPFHVIRLITSVNVAIRVACMKHPDQAVLVPATPDVLHANQTLVQASAAKSFWSRTCNMKYCRMSTQGHQTSFQMVHLTKLCNPLKHKVYVNSN